MKEKVYMRDWYFNAGIVGFLRVISGDAMPDELNNIEGLKVGDNYIEFDSALLEDFKEKFRRLAFDMLMNVNIYINKLTDVQREIENIKDEKSGSVKKICSSFSSSYEKFNKTILQKNFADSVNVNDLNDSLRDSVDFLKTLNAQRIYDRLIKDKEGKEYLNWFLDDWQLKGIASSANIEKYVKSAEQAAKIKNNNDYCLSCQERKAEFEFNNSISNIIGFNKDNTNWIWGFKSSKSKLCPICALIYTSAFLGMIKLHRYVREERVNCFYFINENANVKVLYQSAVILKRIVERTQENEKRPFVLIIKDAILKTLGEQARAIEENINFIEMAENPKLGGQSTKGYNIYNYNITPPLANFLNQRINTGKFPKGYYKLKDGSYSIDDELIEKAITYSLNYNDMYFYTSLYARERNKNAFYNIYRVNNFIFDYINSLEELEGGKMEERGKVTKKAYANGVKLADELHQQGRDNQIDGIVYGMLNDLKISDKENFLDKYIRLMMSYNMPLLFGSNNEMDDTDSFLQFGYSFINGLLKNYGSDNSNLKENTNG